MAHICNVFKLLILFSLCAFFGVVGGYFYILIYQDHSPTNPCSISLSDSLAMANTYIVYTTLICTIIALVSGLVSIILSNTISTKKQEAIDEIKQELLQKTIEEIIKGEEDREKVINDIRNKVQDILQKTLDSEEVQNAILRKGSSIIEKRSSENANTDENQQL